MDGQRVIIAGAGPIGAVLAYALRKRNIPVVLIEALPTPEIDCRAASCHPPTVAMLDELGLLEDGLERGSSTRSCARSCRGCATIPMRIFALRRA